jgi:hypothetical protein
VGIYARWSQSEQAIYQLLPEKFKTNGVQSATSEQLRGKGDSNPSWRLLRV